MKKKLVGVVTSDSTSQMRRVEVQRVFRHKIYHKTLRRKVVCHVHDERNLSTVGQVVEIVECRPLSKLKRWAFVRVM